MYKYKVSVIVPVFNVEQYIEKCAKSLFSQTMSPDNLQIIFINDKTPDKSFNIINEVLKEFPQRKSSVFFIEHKVNKGLPQARISGTQYAEGEYVIHCDSDDWVEPDMYLRMYEYAKKEDLDILRCNFFIEKGKRSTSVLEPESTASGYQEAGEILCGHKNGYLWRTLVRHNLYDKGVLSPKANMIEDVTFLVQLCFYANKVGNMPACFYHYRINDKGMTYNPSDDNIRKQVLDQVSNIKVIEEFLRSKCALAEFRNQLICRKTIVKDCAWQLVHNHSDIHIWTDIFPEINKAIFYNPLIKKADKIYYKMIERHMPLYSINIAHKAISSWYRLKSLIYKLIKK